MPRLHIILIFFTFISLLPGCTAKDGKNSTLDATLLYVSEQGWEDVGKLLLHMGANIDARDNKSRTPLMLASGFGHIGFVKVLVDNGASLNAKNDENLTALGYAKRFGAGDIAAFLKELGAT